MEDVRRLERLEARGRMLEEENERLRARIADLEETLLGDRTIEAPVEWRLTPMQARVFAALLAREHLNKAGLMTALYDERRDIDRPEPKIADVLICKLRRKLAPFAVRIETRWGEGWRLHPEDRARLRGEIAQRKRA